MPRQSILAAFLLSVCLTLASTALAAHPADAVTGTVKDGQGKAVVGAVVLVQTGDRSTVASTTSDAQGAFTFATLPSGNYLIVVTHGAFAEARLPMAVSSGTAHVDVVLTIATMRDSATVTASRDSVEAAGRTGQPVNVITGAEIADRAKTVVAQAVEFEPGVQLQRTSPSMAGVFIRGLVGNKVNMYVDGVRYSNGAQRGGVNTFLDLVDAGGLDAIEVLRGPSSDQYGSDALGGSIHFFSKTPALSGGGKRYGGSASVSGGTGHRNAGGSLFGSVAGENFGVTASLSGRNVGLIRPGGGVDSHAAVTRFFGVPSNTLMPARLPGTGFHQYGGQVRLTYVPNVQTQFTTSYQRSYQDGANRYDQLLGGDGNLVAQLNGLSLDLFTARLERHAAGPFQEVSLTYGLNRQIEERVNQGGQGSATASIGHEPETTTSHSLAASALRRLGANATLSVGGDIQFENLTSGAYNENPVTGAISTRRPRVPSNATFRQGGLYAQASFDVVPDKARLTGAIRYGNAKYQAKAIDAPIVSGAALWPNDQLSVNGVGYRAAAVITPVEGWTLSALVSRGFRAPHMTDLGTLGLTGSGFEVAYADLVAAGLSGSVGTTADATATVRSAAGELGPETSLNVEGTISYHSAKFRTDLTGFVNQVHDNIQKVSLILPAGTVGKTLGGTPITSQNANGVVFVAASTAPVLVRANFDNARYWGIEHSLTADLGHGLMARTAFTYIRGEDTDTQLPPNIEGGIPHPQFSVVTRWTHASGKLYIEPYLTVAWKQTHLSSLDSGDRRTGSGRSTTNIRNFFNNGARNRGWIGNGADGVSGTADDILTATGETLAQITTRVLGTASSLSLFAAIPGWTAIGTRIGGRLGRGELVLDFENLTDENYRGMSWGMDAPGRGVSARYVVKF